VDGIAAIARLGWSVLGGARASLGVPTDQRRRAQLTLNPSLASSIDRWSRKAAASELLNIRMRASERVRAALRSLIVERFAGLETVEPFAQLLAACRRSAAVRRQLAPPSQAWSFMRRRIRRRRCRITIRFRVDGLLAELGSPGHHVRAFFILEQRARCGSSRSRAVRLAALTFDQRLRLVKHRCDEFAVSDLAILGRASRTPIARPRFRARAMPRRSALARAETRAHAVDTLTAPAST